MKKLFRKALVYNSLLVLALSGCDKLNNLEKILESNAHASSQQARKKFVMLDPGHGMGNRNKGKFDPGCCYEKYREADINLQLALRTGDFLISQNIESGYTRATNDAETPLDNRYKLANSSNAPLFISFHCDSSEDEQTRGIKVYHFPASEKGRELATSIYNSLIGSLKTNKVDFKEQGVREETFRVLKKTNMPAVLIEAGYLSNPQDRAYLLEEQDVIANAIASGIARFVKSN